MRSAYILCICVFIAACTYIDSDAAGGTPSAIRDAYLIAHGMALGYRGQMHADPQVSAELERLDAQAAAAVRGMDGTGSPDDSAKAVAALTDYAARQTTLAR